MVFIVMAALCRIRTPEAYKQANVESLPTCAGTVNYFKIIYIYKKESMHSIPPTLPNQLNMDWFSIDHVKEVFILSGPEKI